MKAQDHILAWIESDRDHYARLLEIEQLRKASTIPHLKSCNTLERASRLVADAYREMVRTGDASRDDPYSAADLVLAVALVTIWELEA